MLSKSEKNVYNHKFIKITLFEILYFIKREEKTSVSLKIKKNWNTWEQTLNKSCIGITFINNIFIFSIL